MCLIQKYEKNKTNKKKTLVDSFIHQRADSRSKKNYNPAACGTKTTFTERQDEKAEDYVPDEGTR